MEKKSLRFALVLNGTPKQDGSLDYSLNWINTGIPGTEVALWTRSWLEFIEDGLKKGMQDKFAKN